MESPSLAPRGHRLGFCHVAVVTPGESLSGRCGGCGAGVAAVVIKLVLVNDWQWLITMVDNSG